MFTSITHKFRKILSPISINEDAARSEFILNILLLSCLCLSIITFVINVSEELFERLPPGISAFTTLLPMLFFFFLYFLSRKGYYLVASYCLLGIFFFFATYEIYTWGADLPPALLSYALIIVMAGVLINTRFAFITTVVISVFIIVISYLQMNHAIVMNSYWKKDTVDKADFVVFVIIFLIIATVSWLSNRDIEKSLRRARISEAALKKERDSLEITVEEKTRELRDAQAEKIGQLYRFAEFGRLSSGLFHDLINPLSAVSLNIEMAENKNALARALQATKEIEGLVGTIRKQLSRQENNTHFSLNEEINQTIVALKYKAMLMDVRVNFPNTEQVGIFGDAIKFHHAVLNLLSNAIDAYADMPRTGTSRHIEISLKKERALIIITIKDTGAGIAPENIEKIFESFFTTKNNTHGIGIGLSMTKRIIEKDFGGSIHVESTVGQGSLFTVTFPIT